MNFKNHLLAGTATGIITGATAWYITKNPSIGLVFAGVTVIGSLISDLDTGSIPSRIFAWIGIAASCFMLYTGKPKIAAVIGIIFMFFNLDHHRGFTHKWILPIVCFIAGGMALRYPQFRMYVALIPLGIGIATHLAADKIPPYKII